LREFVFGDLRFLNVDGQRKVNGAGPSGSRGAEGGGHELRDAGLVVDQPRALGHRCGHADLVDLLEGRHTLLGHLGRPGDEYDRGLGGVDGRKGGNGIGKAGPAGEDARRRTAGDPGISVGHVQRRAFMPGVDELPSSSAASTKGKMVSPTMVNTFSMPSNLRHRMKRWAPVSFAIFPPGRFGL